MKKAVKGYFQYCQVKGLHCKHVATCKKMPYEECAMERRMIAGSQKAELAAFGAI